MTAVASGWPFLVARGRRRGYRTVLAPEFLVGPRLHSLLADAPERSGEGPRSVELSPAHVGRLTLVYETKIVTAADIGGVALDEHGRELEIRYGIVLRGGAGATGDLPYGVRERALSSYRKFLADEDSFDVEASEAIQLQAGSPSNKPEHEPERRSQKRVVFVIVLGVVVALVISVLWLTRLAKPDEPMPVKTPVATASPVPTMTPIATTTPLATPAPTSSPNNTAPTTTRPR